MMTWVIEFMWAYSRVLAWVCQMIGFTGLALFAYIGIRTGIVALIDNN